MAFQPEGGASAGRLAQQPKHTVVFFASGMGTGPLVEGAQHHHHGPIESSKVGCLRLARDLKVRLLRERLDTGWAALLHAGERAPQRGIQLPACAWLGPGHGHNRLPQHARSVLSLRIQPLSHRAPRFPIYLHLLRQVHKVRVSQLLVCLSISSLCPCAAGDQEHDSAEAPAAFLAQPSHSIHHWAWGMGSLHDSPS